MTTTITSDCTVQEFQTKYDLRVNGANVFIECGDVIIEDFRDVMLMDKVIIIIIIILLTTIMCCNGTHTNLQKTDKLFTGSTARSDLTAYLDKYRVFVLPCNVE